MSFAWDFNSNGTVDTYEPHPHFTFTEAGVHVATLTITTSASRKSCTIPVDVASEGNTAPDVRVVFPPQGGVFTWGDQVDFKVSLLKLRISFLVAFDFSVHAFNDRAA